MSNSIVDRSLAGLAKFADLFQAPFALITRVYVSWVFLWSGWLKIRDWEQTLALFEYEYRVPLLSPFWAAIAGTAGEVVFPILLILGFGGRLPALGLFFVNLLAVISTWHWYAEDSAIAGLRQHYIWGFMLAMLFFYGSGAWSLDRLRNSRR